MSLEDSINNDISQTIRAPWALRQGNIVPSTESVALNGGAVEIEATFLYADFADSSKIAKLFDRRIAAKILKSFLSTSCRLIRHNGGTIQSFDGDRVMAVFVGHQKNTNAAKCALQINFVVSQVIRPKFETMYDSVKNAPFSLRHAVGVDFGKAFAVRAGARGANDLIWIGRSPNLAAKLSDQRESPHHTFITTAVYNAMLDAVKFGGEPRRSMWERRNWSFLNDTITIYRSDWWWRP